MGSLDQVMSERIESNDSIDVCLTDYGMIIYSEMFHTPAPRVFKTSLWVFARQFGPYMRAGALKVFEWIEKSKTV